MAPFKLMPSNRFKDSTIWTTLSCAQGPSYALFNGWNQGLSYATSPKACYVKQTLSSNSTIILYPNMPVVSIVRALNPTPQNEIAESLQFLLLSASPACLRLMEWNLLDSHFPHLLYLELWHISLFHIKYCI